VQTTRTDKVAPWRKWASRESIDQNQTRRGIFKY
jgi:hypothetical protein